MSGCCVFPYEELYQADRPQARAIDKAIVLVLITAYSAGAFFVVSVLINALR